MSKNTVSRDQANVVLQAIHDTYDIKPGNEPILREHDHEGLPPGCWSIDWEHGGPTWNHSFSAEFDFPFGFEGHGEVVKPIGPYAIGIFPA